MQRKWLRAKAAGRSTRTGWLRTHGLLAAIIVVSAQATWGAPQAEPYPMQVSGAVSSAAKSANSGQAPERWDVLPLSGNRLHASAPLFGEKDVQPEFTRELLRVQWRQNDPIDLYVIRPVHVQKPPVVLLLYSYPSETDRFLDDGYCKSVVSHGFAAVGFVSALTGHRYHDRPMKEWFVSELQESLGASVHDVQMILNYLDTRTDLDTRRVGMYGQGSGGTIAILAAANDERIQAVDVLDPWGDWPEWLAKTPIIPEEERAAFLTPEFLRGVTPLDPVEWLPRLNSRSLRLQQTQFSQVTPPEARTRLKISLLPTADSVLYNDIEDYKKRALGDSKVFHWLEEKLGSIGHVN